MNIGDHVIIRTNPHEPKLVELVGQISAVARGEGRAGADLFDVAYIDPYSGRRYTHPFSCDLIETATAERLQQLADLFEGRAAELRQAAQSLRWPDR